MAGGNPSRTCCCVIGIPQPPLRPATPSLLQISRLQVLSYSDGTLYAASSGDPNRLTAIDAGSGSILWTFDIPATTGSMNHVPAVTDELVLVSGQHATALYALHRQDGTLAWSVPIGSAYSRNAIIDGDRAYIVTDSLHCIDLTAGALLWSYASFDAQTTPAVDDDAVYVVGDRVLTAIEKLTGQEIWSIPADERSYGHVIAADDALYASDRWAVRAVSKTDGAVQWTAPFPEVRFFAQFSTGCLALSDDVLCVGIWEDTTGVGGLVALDRSSGDRIWSYFFETEGVFSPVIVGNTVYVTDYVNDALWGFRLSDGTLVFENREASYLGQPIPADGKLYVPSSGGIRVFEEGTVGVATHNPPAAAMQLDIAPNPARDAVAVTVSLRKPTPLRVSVHDLLGREIAVIANASYDAGRHVFRWNAAAGSIATVPAGIYLVTARGGDMQQTKSLLLY